MTPTTLFSTNGGVLRLTTAPADLEPRPAVLIKGNAPSAYQQLFEEYRNRLWDAHLVAVPWWEGTIEAQQRLGQSRAQAIENSFNKRVAGAAAHPKVVHVLREFWLRCDELAGAYPDRTVAPETLLLGWLVDDGETDLVAMLACMPYWPIGMDGDGNWV